MTVGVPDEDWNWNKDEAVTETDRRLYITHTCAWLYLGNGFGSDVCCFDQTI